MDQYAMPIMRYDYNRNVWQVLGPDGWQDGPTAEEMDALRYTVRFTYSDHEGEDNNMARINISLGATGYRVCINSNSSTEETHYFSTLEDMIEFLREYCMEHGMDFDFEED